MKKAWESVFQETKHSAHSLLISVFWVKPVIYLVIFWDKTKNDIWNNGVECTTGLYINQADLFKELAIFCGWEAGLDAAFHRAIHQLSGFD